MAFLSLEPNLTDNEVLVDAKKHYLRVGDFVDLEIVEAADFDLYAEPVDSSI